MAPRADDPYAGPATGLLDPGELDALDADEYEQPPPDDIPELPFLSGLEGLRAVALVAVLAFASGISLVQGGFLGISTAFTLSGFLLTCAVLSDWGQRSKLALGDLWERRATRLIPLTYAVVALVILLQMTLRVGSVPSFQTDVWAGVAFATNWQQAFPSGGFAQNFQNLSALQHLWPIAILVQLTVVLAAVLAGVLAVANRRWRAAAAVFALLTAVSFALAWILGGSAEASDLVYYGTHTRAGEVLVGVLLAFVVLTPRFRALILRPRIMSLVRLGAPAAALGLLALWVMVPIESSRVFQGGTLLNAALTAWVVLAVTMPGPVSTALGSWPLQKLGEVSFAAYLLHWPIFLFLDTDRTSLEGPVLFAVRLVATLVAAAAATWAIEATFRWRLRLPRLQLAAGLGATAAILAVLALILPVNPPANISLAVNDGRGPGELDVVSPSGTEAARVLLVGDQTVGSMAEGFEAWNEDNPEAQLRVDTHVAADCPIGGPWDTRRFGEALPPTDDCISWRFRLPRMLEAADYDAVLVGLGTADLGERELRRDWHSLGDPAFDQWLADQFSSLATDLEEANAPILWMTTPHMRVVPEVDGGEGPVDWAQFDENDPQRVDRFNTILSGVVRSDSSVGLIDLNAWMQNQAFSEFNPDMREGATFGDEGAARVTSWLAPQVLEAAEVTLPSSDEEGSGEADTESDADSADSDITDADTDGDDLPVAEGDELPPSGDGG